MRAVESASKTCRKIDASVLDDFQDPIVSAVGNIDFAAGANGDPMRLKEFDFQRRSTDTGTSLFARSCQLDDSIVFRQIPADRVVLCIGNQDTSVLVEA